MEKELFLQWLLEKRELAFKASRDAASRCKRVEAILGQRLEKATASQVAFDAALTKIWRIHPHRKDLLYAMRLYAGFKNPAIDTKLYAFYGAVNTMRAPGEARKAQTRTRLKKGD
jgi:hypothetical protein